MISLTIILIGITVLISMQGFNNTAFKQKLIFHPYSIREKGEYYRFLTHGFLHANWEHLLINMYVLYIFGEFIEPRFAGIFPAGLGKTLYLLMYLAAIVVSSVPSFFKHKENPYYSALGASGATSALVFSFILFRPWDWFLFPPLPALLFGIAYLWYSNYMSKRGRDNIGHDAHFYGAVFGLLFTLAAVSILQPSVLNSFLSELLQGPGKPGFFQ